MEVNKIQRQLLNWASGATRDDRYRFLKRFLDILPDEELAQVTNNASKAKKRRRRQQRKNEISDPKVQLEVPQEKSVSVPAKPAFLPEESVSVPEVGGKEGVDKSLHGTSVSEPVTKEEKWFHKFSDENIVGLDVEKVHCPISGPKKQYEMKAAIVSIVNHLGKVIYSAKIRHLPGTFRVWHYTLEKNGITEDSLKNGKPLETVKSEVRKILEGKLVVLLEAEADFSSLDLPLADFEYFDCTQFWYRGYISKKGKYYTEKLGLRSLCHFYFGEDMQPDGVIHDASNDAAWTVKLFMDVYKSHQLNSYRVNPNDSNEIPHYKPN